MNYLFIITGISGSGKTTLAEYLQNRHSFHKVKTCTTRSPRHNESDDSYIFLTKSEFENNIENGDMLEYVQSYNNYYGTQRSSININKQNQVLCLDLAGAKTLKNQYKNRAVLILMNVCDKQCLRKRIQSRSHISQEELEHRMQDMKMYQDYKQYDHIIDASQSLCDVYETFERDVLAAYYEKV